jgi:hypothetical protein
MVKEVKEKQEYLLNKVEGFNPYDHLEPATDWSTGETITEDTGEVKMFLPVRAQETWFRLKYPDGKIVVERVESPSSHVSFLAKIYASKNDPEEAFLAVGYSERYKTPDAAFPVFETCQTAAIGRALTIAGFGCEIKAFVSGEQYAERKVIDLKEIEWPEDMPVKKETIKQGKPKQGKKQEDVKQPELKDAEAVEPVETPEEEKAEKNVGEECETEEEKGDEPKVAIVDLKEVIFESKENGMIGNYALHLGQKISEIYDTKPQVITLISKGTDKLRSQFPSHVLEAIDTFAAME